MTTRKEIGRAHRQIMAVANRQGYITNQQVCDVTVFGQAWYLLDTLRLCGLLKHAAHGRWELVRKKRAPRPPRSIFHCLKPTPPSRCQQCGLTLVQAIQVCDQGCFY